MSLITKLLSISVLPLFLCLIPLLQIKALALDPTTSLSLIIPINVARHETDFHALLAFKSNIFPEYQQALSSWNESLHFCHWEGVKCGHRHGRVIVIDLTSRGLMGSLSPYIGNLSFLHELSLKNNTFIGEIPTELGNLFRLHKLNLEQNGFKGTIPTSLFHCSNLTYLSVSRNKLVGEFPKKLAYFMPRLVTLYIDNNNFTGGHGIPPSIGNLTSLEHFDASNNPFGGSIPNALGQLKNLRELWLGNTTISGTIPPALYNLSLLVRLSVPHNRLWGSLPPSFGFMFSHLEALQLFTNKFNGPIPLSISNCSQLVQLELSENNFSGSLRNDFGALRNLRFIILSDNNFKTRGSNGLSFLSSFINCSNLEWMGLENNQFGGVLPNLVGNLSLDQLGLSGNQIYGSIPSTIGNLVNLEVLDLNDNLFTGSIPESVGYLHKLQYLGFSNNKISGEIPKSIGNLSMMNELYLEKNRLEGAIPGSLGNCQKLLILTLSDNNLNGSIPRQLLMVSSLSIALHLARNHLSGSLPPEVGKLKNLAEIDISENGLSGEIPNTLGSCSSLENLFLQRNFFQGSIPPSMEFMRGIQNLDLSHNNLSGQIPRFLGTFDLKNLNLSFNNFEGELPMKGVFTNASTISIAGNHRLCGGISELQLPRCKTKKSRNKMSRSQMLGIMAASVLVGVTAVSSFLICWFKKKRNTKPAVSLLKDSFLKVSYGELLKATEGFSSTNLLGFGSFGRVYKGVIEQNGELVVAVKVLDLQTCGATKSFVAECEALRNIRHRNLVSIITSCSSMDFQGNEFKALVYEFMPNGSLDKWLHAIPEENNGEHELVGLNLLQRVDIAMDIACALDYLHHQCEMPIIHRDLKPSNILLDDDMVAHVGDFGLARFRAELNIPSTSSSTAIRGTIGYAAPEYGMGSEMSTSGDVYSYGILLLEMITRKRPTDKMFEANLNLHNFARIALPHRVMEIVDPMLLTEETYGSKIMENMISLIKIGLTCSTESPKNRMNINTALHELQLIKNNILKVQTSGTHSLHV